MIKRSLVLIFSFGIQLSQAHAASNQERLKKILVVQEAQLTSLKSQWKNGSNDQRIGQDLDDVQRLLLSVSVNSNQGKLSDESSKVLASTQVKLDKIKTEIITPIVTCTFEGQQYKVGQTWFKNTLNRRIEYTCKTDGTVSESISCLPNYRNVGTGTTLICIRNTRPIVLDPCFDSEINCSPDTPVTGPIDTGVKNPECSEGSYWNGLRCAPITNSIPKVQNPECSEGSFWNGLKCVPSRH